MKKLILILIGFLIPGTLLSQKRIPVRNKHNQVIGYQRITKTKQGTKIETKYKDKSSETILVTKKGTKVIKSTKKR